jgi:hypothetical protein
MYYSDSAKECPAWSMELRQPRFSQRTPQSMHETAPISVEALKAQVLADRARAQFLLAEIMTAHGEPVLGARPDLFKQVTGHSSMEQAIDNARRLIDGYDRVLSQLDRLGGGGGEVVTTKMVAMWKAGAYAGLAG